ncbi:hypothetical protein P4S63_25665 [Pseudoalteromonas sp. B193]
MVLKNGGELTFTKEQAQGFTDDMSENGVYFGHIGNGQWQAALVRNDDIFGVINSALKALITYKPRLLLKTATWQIYYYVMIMAHSLTYLSNGISL